MFRFCPAGLDTCQEAPSVLYCKYGSFGNEMKVLAQNPRMLQIQLPDRILTFAQDSDKISHYKHLDWDECLPVSPFHRVSNNIDYPDFAMINYVANYGRFNKCAKSCKLGKDPNRLKLISDSGGFQMLVGRVTYIDPKNLANFYNENADIGIVLDIPLYNGVDNDTLVKFAKLQKKNTRRLMDNLDGSVELLNVCHGYEPDKYFKYLDIVEEDEIGRLCIGGLNFMSSIVNSLSSFIRIVERYKSKYKHFHILGVYNPSILSCFIYLAETMFKDVLITSDASTALQSSRSGLLHLQREFNKPSERLIIGSKTNKLQHFNQFRQIPCCCPICRLVKYTDVFSFMLSNPVIRILTIHNILEINKVLMSLATMATQMSFDDYLNVLKSILKRHSGYDITVTGFNYIKTVLEHGIDKADLKYKQYFNRGLFKTYTVQTLTDDEQVEAFNWYTSDLKDKLDVIYKNYKSGKCVETFKTIKKEDRK